MPNLKGFKERPDSKFQPDVAGGYDANYNGDTHEFNIKGKITNVSGSDYHDGARGNSGLYGNFAEKDASMEYLRNRNKDGQEIRNYNATSEMAKLKTGGGATAYDSMPIPEVYKPATSQGSVPPNAIEYRTKDKDRNISFPKEQDTSGNNLTEDITKHVKSKA